MFENYIDVYTRCNLLGYKYKNWQSATKFPLRYGIRLNDHRKQI